MNSWFTEVLWEVNMKVSKEIISEENKVNGWSHLTSINGNFSWHGVVSLTETDREWPNIVLNNLVKCESGTSSEKYRGSSGFCGRFNLTVIICNSSSVEWHWDTEIIIDGCCWCSLDHQITCFQVDCQWLVENCPHYCFVTGRSGQTTFISK